MKSSLFLQVFRRTNAGEDIVDIHRRYISYWQGKGGPFGLPEGFQDSDPMFREGELVAVHFLNTPKDDLRLSFDYKFRSDKFLRNEAFYDDSLIVKLKFGSVQYRTLLRDWLPQMAKSFGAYRVQVLPLDYVMAYTDSGWNEWADRPSSNPGYHRLREAPGVDVDGRNNIFTLHPGMFWDSELCKRALGYGPAEVERRIKNEAPLVELTENGIHLVLNENADMCFDEYVDMNEYFGRLLEIDRG